MSEPIDPARTALLVMDYQNGILASLDTAEALLTRASSAIADVRKAGGTVGYVRVAFEDGDYAAVPSHSRFAQVASTMRDAFHASSPATAVHDAIAPEADDIVVRKTRVGAFSTTDLEAQLRARGITTLVLAGVATSGVVLSTVREASDRDYRLFVLADACADRDPEVHDLLVRKVFPGQASVLSTGELAGLLRTT